MPAKPIPNKFGVDGDLRTTPLFAWDTELATECPSWAPVIQHVVFFPFLTLYFFVFDFGPHGAVWVKKYYGDLGFMCLLWLIVYWWFMWRAHPYLVSALIGANADPNSSEEWWTRFMVLATVYIAGIMLQGAYLGFFFGLSHFAVVRIEDTKTGWARWQTETSVNWGIGSWFAAIACGFLCLQIEHHLFPQCPPFAYVALQKDCSKYLKGKGMRYVEYSLYEATAHLLAVMRDTGREVRATRAGKSELVVPCGVAEKNV